MSGKEGNSKVVIYGIAAAAALIGGAILFNYVSGKSGSAPSTTAVFDEIEALGPSKKEANGLLSFTYYKDVFLIITKHSKLRFAVEKKELLTKRRRSHKDGN